MRSWLKIPAYRISPLFGTVFILNKLLTPGARLTTCIVNVPSSHGNTGRALGYLGEMAIPERAPGGAREMTQWREELGVEKNGPDNPEEDSGELKAAEYLDESRRRPFCLA